MLKRIHEIQGVGLFKETKPNRFNYEQATFIYADNGRGKSTLASIFRSISTKDSSIIIDRKTIGGGEKQKVVFDFDSSNKYTYDNGRWDKQYKNILVFDANFIEKNVHSGEVIGTDHRRNLLEFALGSAAVAARSKVEDTIRLAKIATEQEKEVVAKLSGHHIGMPLDSFEKLEQDLDIDKKIVDITKRIDNSRNIDIIKNKIVPKKISIPQFQIDNFFKILRKSLEDIHSVSDNLVRQHLLHINQKSVGDWLSQGQKFDDGKTCPYCAQATKEVSLIKQYKSYFNQEFNSLKSEVNEVKNRVIKETSNNIIDIFLKSTEIASANAKLWESLIDVPTFSFNTDKSTDALNNIRKIALELIQAKQNSLTESIGTHEEKQKIIDLWNSVTEPMKETNELIGNFGKEIAAYQAKLQSEDSQNLLKEKTKLEVTKRRYDSNVVTLIEKLQRARANVKEQEKSKLDARKALNDTMSTTLSTYQTAINELLEKFGASFSIKKMDANFRGAAPRSEYGLQLKGEDVSLEKFSTTLSEGDKRTLAFAFFVASVIQDVNIAQKIVVIDDPMCSLDSTRKSHTNQVLLTIYEKSKQLIVLAHDHYFIRNLSEFLKKNKPEAGISIFQITCKNDHSIFSEVDIIKKCESKYEMNHRILTDFFNGSTNSDSPLSVAKCIRPMLEGYLHRRFPQKIDNGLLFGQIVKLIENANEESPLHNAKNIVAELNEINTYAGKFHHDTNKNLDSEVVNDSELMRYVKRALKVSYT